MSGLHKPKASDSKHDSTVAYQVTYYPWTALGVKGLRSIVWHKSLLLGKNQLLDCLTEDRNEIFFPKDSSLFRLVWEYNNVPSLTQWDGLPEDALIRVQFRISPLIEGTGRVAILSLLDSRKSEIVKDWNEA